MNGLEKLGRKAWEQEVTDIVTKLKLAFVADYVVLGGGNAKQMKELPKALSSATIATLIPVACDFGKPIRARASQSGT